MSASVWGRAARRRAVGAGRRDLIAWGALGTLGLACLLAPVGMAVAVVLLCAGPHNWCEARYFLSRMPPRWGSLRGFFATGVAGVAGLSVAFMALAWTASADQETHLTRLAIWHTALIVWVAVLLTLRQRQPSAAPVPWLVPVALVAVALAWALPLHASVGLVYLHPLLALAFLERELRVRRATWYPVFRRGLAVVPLVVAALWWWTTPTDAAAIAQRPEAWQAGAFLVPDAWGQPMLATHVFLESVHYGVWILGIPLVTAAAPWHLQRVPLARRSTQWRQLLAVALAMGLVAVAVLWIAFAIDYEITRRAYFTLAIVHVLAEIPFLVLSR